MPKHMKLTSHQREARLLHTYHLAVRHKVVTLDYNPKPQPKKPSTDSSTTQPKGTRQSARIATRSTAAGSNTSSARDEAGPPSPTASDEGRDNSARSSPLSDEDGNVAPLSPMSLGELEATSPRRNAPEPEATSPRRASPEDDARIMSARSSPLSDEDGNVAPHSPMALSELEATSPRRTAPEPEATSPRRASPEDDAGLMSVRSSPLSDEDGNVSPPLPLFPREAEPAAHRGASPSGEADGAGTTAPLPMSSTDTAGVSPSEPNHAQASVVGAPPPPTPAADKPTAVEEVHNLVDDEDRTMYKDGTPNIVFRRNLTLLNREGDVLLQRFRPPSYRAHKKMEAEAAKGRALYDRVVKYARCDHLVPSSRTASSFPHYHFGIWNGQGQRDLVKTAETLQRGNKEGQMAVMAFLAWLRNYLTWYVQYLVDAKPSDPAIGSDGECEIDGLHPTYVQAYKDREELYKWLKSEILDADFLCHPLYSTCSPFHGFSESAHKDVSDLPATILLNFGSQALLELPDYDASVLLEPVDTVFFDARTVRHSTRPLPINVNNGVDEAERWAISCFYRSVVNDRRENGTFQTGDLRTMAAWHAEAYRTPKKRKTGSSNRSTAARRS